MSVFTNVLLLIRYCVDRVTNCCFLGVAKKVAGSKLPCGTPFIGAIYWYTLPLALFNNGI